MPRTVAVLGGGVAGLSAAHELCERGFQVSVYERKSILGGKARSLSLPGTGTGGRKDLPGEHGFRFFPAFYRHLPDTMKRIPFGAGSTTVFDNLVAASRIEVARAGLPAIILPAKAPQDEADWAAALQVMFTGIGVPDDEVLFFVDRLLVLMTSCPERRLAEYETISWWNFIGAPARSRAYQRLLAEGLTRSLVALRAEEGSTRTVGYTLLQLLYGILSPQGFDRLLRGPTNDVWLTPWVDYLQQKGVTFTTGTVVNALNVSAAGVSSVGALQGGTKQDITADYYIAALPVEIMQTLLTDDVRRFVPSLAGIGNLTTAWMNGIQFYLRNDVPLQPGHTLYADSPWALTSISQRQFWTAGLAGYGDGTTGGILSVDISDWNAPGILTGKQATQCTRDEVKDEVWAQLKVHLNTAGAEVLEDGNLQSWFLDPDIEYPNPSVAANLEPLLVNTTGSLLWRPEASTAAPNLFLASDYVRTYTDVACMEAANEAARRAVNGILAASGSSSPEAALWPLWEPDFFVAMIAYDRIRFGLGLPHGISPP